MRLWLDLAEVSILPLREIRATSRLHNYTRTSQLLPSSVGRGVCHGVTRRDTTRLSIHDVRFRATAAISVPGGSGHTRFYRDQVRAASLQVPLLSNTVAGSVSTTRCVWPVFAISAYAGVTVSTITVRVYSIEPGPVMVTSIGS